MSTLFPVAGDGRESPLEVRDWKKEGFSPPFMPNLRFNITVSFPRSKGDAVGKRCKDHVSL